MDLRMNLIERRMVELDATLAKHYLGFNKYEMQRTIRKAHVFDLANKMKSGLFRFGEVAFANMAVKGDIMVNGQHVCSAAIESGITVPVCFEKYKVHDEGELSELFRQFEILPRSLREMVRVEASSLHVEWPLAISTLIVAAAAIEALGYKSKEPAGLVGNVRAKKWFTKDDRVELLKDYLEEGKFVARVIANRRSHRHLARAAVVYMMFQTYRLDPDKALAFWVKVRDGEYLSKEMPEMKLRNFLLGSSGIGQNNRMVRNHEYCYRIAQAWNAMQKGARTQLAYYADKPVPGLVG